MSKSKVTKNAVSSNVMCLGGLLCFAIILLFVIIGISWKYIVDKEVTTEVVVCSFLLLTIALLLSFYLMRLFMIKTIEIEKEIRDYQRKVLKEFFSSCENFKEIRENSSLLNYYKENYISLMDEQLTQEKNKL